MLAQTVEEEVEAFVAAHEHITDGKGRRLAIRNGYLPERTIQTGIGDIAVKAPRARDRSGSGIRFFGRFDFSPGQWALKNTAPALG